MRTTRENRNDKLFNVEMDNDDDDDDDKNNAGTRTRWWWSYGVRVNVMIPCIEEIKMEKCECQVLFEYLEL